MSEKNRNVIELVDLILDGVSVGLDASKDGRISIEDAGLLLRLIPNLGPALAEIEKVPSELAAMSAEDAGALALHVMEKLAIADAHARKVIDASLKAAVSVYALVQAIKEQSVVVAPAPVEVAPVAPQA